MTAWDIQPNVDARLDLASSARFSVVDFRRCKSFQANACQNALGNSSPSLFVFTRRGPARPLLCRHLDAQLDDRTRELNDVRKRRSTLNCAAPANKALGSRPSNAQRMIGHASHEKATMSFQQQLDSWTRQQSRRHPL
jgi:hypothetical protein